MRSRTIRFSLCLVFLVALAGCGKVSLENYEKISNDMTQAQVEDILGSGTQEKSGGASIGDISLSGNVVRWGDDEKHIKVTFMNKKVIAKTQKGL